MSQEDLSESIVGRAILGADEQAIRRVVREELERRDKLRYEARVKILNEQFRGLWMVKEEGEGQR